MRMRSAWMLLLAACCLVGPAVMPPARADDEESPVYPANARPFGQSFAQWSTNHWQWLFSFPADSHPLDDTAPPEAGQSGHVWFIGGTFETIEIAPNVIYGQADRTINLPVGTALFFPLVDVEGSDIEGNGSTDAELMDYAAFFADFIDNDSLALTIDGKSVPHLSDYRFPSPAFTFGPLPENNLLSGYPGGVAGAFGRSASDGVFVMLKPLPVGSHTIHYFAVLDLASIGGPTFIQDIRYVVNVRN